MEHCTSLSNGHPQNSNFENRHHSRVLRYPDRYGTSLHPQPETFYYDKSTRDYLKDKECEFDLLSTHVQSRKYDTGSTLSNVYYKKNANRRKIRNNQGRLQNKENNDSQPRPRLNPDARTMTSSSCDKKQQLSDSTGLQHVIREKRRIDNRHAPFRRGMRFANHSDSEYIHITNSDPGFQSADYRWNGDKQRNYMYDSNLPLKYNKGNRSSATFCYSRNVRGKSNDRIIKENASSSDLPMICSPEEKCYSNNQATTEMKHFEHLERQKLQIHLNGRDQSMHLNNPGLLMDNTRDGCSGLDYSLHDEVNVARAIQSEDLYTTDTEPLVLEIAGCRPVIPSIF